MLPRTIFLSKLLGLYYALIALSMFLHKQTYLEIIRALLDNAPVMFVASIVALLTGLAMVLAHNIWSRGSRTVIVTLLGWIILTKGLLFLFLPPQMEARIFLSRLHFEQLFHMYATISLVLGVYLSYGGIASPRS